MKRQKVSLTYFFFNLATGVFNRSALQKKTSAGTLTAEIQAEFRRRVHCKGKVLDGISETPRVGGRKLGTMKKAYFLICIACAFLLGFVTCFYVTRRAHERKTATAAGTETAVTDSVKTMHPTPAEVRDAGCEVVTVSMEAAFNPLQASPIPLQRVGAEIPQASSAKTPLLLERTGEVGSVSDALRAVIPITQKVYRDSLYTAYVSVFRAQPDSITVRQRTVTVHQTVTLPQPTTRRSRFTFGLTVGAGYGLFTRKPDIFVGAGVIVRL